MLRDALGESENHKIPGTFLLFGVTWEQIKGKVESVKIRKSCVT